MSRVARPTGRARLAAWGFGLAWTLNVVLLAAACAWIAGDGQFMEPAITSKPQLTMNGGSASSVVTSVVEPMSPDRMRMLALLLAGTIASLALMFVSLFLGAPRHRSLRSWLALTAMVAAWLTLWAAWPELAWAGKRWRVGRDISEFESIAKSFRHDWPIADDVTPELGPFSAYPNGRPAILMPLLAPGGRGNHAPFSVIERSNKGALRFELVSRESGAWLEWHPSNSQPASFTGGLETEYELVRSSRLDDGWYLTRYRASGLAKSF